MGTRFLTPRSNPNDTDQVSPTLCSVQFWLLVSRGRQRKRRTRVRAMVFLVVSFIYALPILIWLNDRVVSLHR